MPVYLDCNATTPIEEAVKAEVIKYMEDEYGNAGSRTHSYGAKAKEALEKARGQVASVAGASKDEVLFTSGATESNNMALLGLSDFGLLSGKRHIVISAIEHKAVLEPAEVLVSRGYEISIVKPNSVGRIEVGAVTELVRSDTLFVSVMHVNNETGMIQPVAQLADALNNHDCFIHVDAAQGFGKDLLPLKNRRIDLISISGHKIFAPKGIGALVARKRNHKRPPLSPLTFGGGQERGLRAGTVPVPLAVGLGMAAELSVRDLVKRQASCLSFRSKLLEKLAPFNPRLNGELTEMLPHVLNLSIPGLDSESVILALKDHLAFSNGSACTSSQYSPSHVLSAMGLSSDLIEGAIRLSWCHMTEEPNWDLVSQKLSQIV